MHLSDNGCAGYPGKPYDCLHAVSGRWSTQTLRVKKGLSSISYSLLSFQGGFTVPAYAASKGGDQGIIG